MTTRVCASSNSTALCWGGNFFGQLGDGTKTDRHRPVDREGARPATRPLTNMLGVVAGPVATCAVIKGGGAKCWGFNQGGQFGNGTAQELDPAGACAAVTVTRRASNSGPDRDRVRGLGFGVSADLVARPPVRPSRRPARDRRHRARTCRCVGVGEWLGRVGWLARDPRSTSAWGTNEGPEKAHMRARRERLGSC